jgi:hypothetical protein
MVDFDSYRDVLIEYAAADTLKSAWLVVIALAVFIVASA